MPGMSKKLPFAVSTSAVPSRRCRIFAYPWFVLITGSAWDDSTAAKPPPQADKVSGGLSLLEHGVTASGDPLTRSELLFPNCMAIFHGHRDESEKNEGRGGNEGAGGVGQGLDKDKDGDTNGRSKLE